MAIGTKVRVKDTNIIGKVIRRGQTGLYMLEIITSHSAFDRTVYGKWELEII